MQPLFHFVNQAIYYTVEYYKPYKIREHIYKFAGRFNLEYLDKWVDIAFSMQSRMEDEINQTIFTTNNETKNYLFNLLHSWTDDYRIREINIPIIEKEIDKCNEDIYADFLETHTKAEADFLNHPNYGKWAHLQEYKEEINPSSSLDASIAKYFSPKKVHYKFYCINDEIPFIDKKFLPDYINLIAPIIGNLKRIVDQHTAPNTPLYNASRGLSGTTHFVMESKPKMLPSAEPPREKLKFTITVEQLAFLFKLLKERGIVEARTDMDIHRFISANFETPGTTEKGISTKKLANSYSSPEAKTVNYWVSELRKMIDDCPKL